MFLSSYTITYNRKLLKFEIEGSDTMAALRLILEALFFIIFSFGRPLFSLFRCHTQHCKGTWLLPSLYIALSQGVTNSLKHLRQQFGKVTLQHYTVAILFILVILAKMKTSFKYDGAYEYRLNLRSGSFHTFFLTWSRWNFIVIFYLPSETEIEPDLTLLKIRKKMTNLTSFRESKGLIVFSWRDCSLLLLNSCPGYNTPPSQYRTRLFSVFSARGSLLGDLT